MDQLLRLLLVFQDEKRHLAESLVYEMGTLQVVGSLRGFARAHHTGLIQEHLLHLAECVGRLNEWRNIFAHSLIWVVNEDDLFAQSFKMRGSFKIHQSVVTKSLIDAAITHAIEIGTYVGHLSVIATSDASKIPLQLPSLDQLERPRLPEKDVFKHTRFHP